MERTEYTLPTVSETLHPTAIQTGPPLAIIIITWEGKKRAPLDLNHNFMAQGFPLPCNLVIIMYFYLFIFK